MKITGNIFANNYWLMKVAPLALALSAVVIFFCILYAHIWSVDSCKDYALKNRRINEMLALVRLEIPQYLADNPDTSPKEFAEYCEKIRNERELHINSDLEHWKNPDQKSEITAICDCSSVNAGYIKFNGERGQ